VTPPASAALRERLVITAAIVGAEVTRAQNPHVPYTAEEIGREVQRCADAGASVIHLHVRHPDGRPAHERVLFEAAIRAIRARADVVVQVSTGGAIGMSIAQRTEGLDAGPEMASLTCGSSNFGDEVFANAWPDVCAIAARIRAAGAVPELELFELGHLWSARRLVDEGRVGGHTFQVVLGVQGALPAEPRLLALVLDEIRREQPAAHVGVAAMGRHQLPMAAEAVARGAHVRVGLEDNVYLHRGVLAEGSAPLVERAVALGRAAGREPASAAEVRALLGRLGPAR
jgi:3-keto-5-aminohexanoate cleavage enzyme